MFSFSELLGLAVVQSLVDGLGVSVSRLAPCAGELFAILADHDDFSALPDFLHVTLDGRLALDELPTCEAFASVRIADVFSRIKDGLAPDQRRQLSLPL